MIIVRLMGGLGNQMFQYAIGRSLSYDRGDKLILDTSFFSHKHKNTTVRMYELYHLNINAKASSINLLLYYILYFVRIVVRRYPFLVPNYIVEHELASDTSVLQKRYNNIILDGYWQSEKYFIHNKDIIRNDFQIISKQSDSNNKWNHLIVNTESICLHIRRGDYVTNTNANKLHGVLLGDEGLNYYSRAISYISKHVNKPVFFIFSDDIEWVKENLSIEFETYYMDQNGPSEDYEDLRLMTMCKHFIIANSSFSWWGAWLGGYDEKIVVCPKKWFTDSKIKEDIACDSWIIM